MSSTTSTKPQPASVTKTATCNCRQVSVTATGVDKGSVLCHCSNCQRASGSAFAYNHRLSPAELKFDQGEDVIKQYADGDTKSGNTLMRHFCGNCGCPIYLSNPNFKEMVILHGGSIRHHTAQPKFDLFPENKHTWIGDVSSKSKAKL